MEAVFMLVLGVGFSIIALPVAAIVMALRARDAAKQAQSDLLELEHRHRAAVLQHRELEQRLNAWIAQADQRLAEQRGSVPPSVPSPEQPIPTEASLVPSAPVAPRAPFAAVIHSSTVPGAGFTQHESAPAELRTATQRAPGHDVGPTRPAEFAPATSSDAGTVSGSPTAVAGGTVPPSETIPGAECGAPVCPTPMPREDAHPERSAVDSDELAEPSVLRPPGIDWERLVGVRLFAWVGGAALFLAGALFLHYSIQRNLISPELRVALALVAGAGCLAGGDRLRHRTPFTGFALSGAGVAILYAALFAARALYQLIGTAPAFVGMCLVTVTAGLIAVKRNAYFVALLGLAGGMATPLLLSTGQDRPLALFAYVALLSAAVLVVAKRRRWASLALLGLLFSTIIFTGWALENLSPERVPLALEASTFVCAMFALTRTPVPAPGNGLPRKAPADLGTVSNVLALMVMLVVAFAITSSWDLRVEPVVLSLHLVAVSGIALLVARQHSYGWLLVAAAIGTLLILFQRVNADLFPARRGLALVCLSLPAIAYAGGWLWLRSGAQALTAWRAALILLVGSTALLTRVVAVEPQPVPFAPLFTYAALHTGTLVAMGLVHRRGLPLALGNTGLILALIVLGDATANETALCWAALGSTLGLFGLPLLHPRCRADRTAWLSSAGALPAGFAVSYSVGHEHFGHDLYGAVAIGAAALEVGMLAFVGRRRELSPEDSLFLRAIFGALALGFLTVSVPILLRNEWLTISWALEVAAIAWLHRRIAHRGLVLFAAGLALAVIVRVLLNPALYEYHPRAATPILNHYLYTIGVPAAALFVAARLFVLPPEYSRTHFKGLLSTAATLFLFLLLNVEIADYYSTGSTLTFRWTGGGLAQDMTYSLAWGVFALGLLATGIWLRRRPVRIGALAVLVLTIGKVFLHDLWALGSLYRVGSIVGLAVALLGVSFLTQRLILDREAK